MTIFLETDSTYEKKLDLIVSRIQKSINVLGSPHVKPRAAFWLPYGAHMCISDRWVGADKHSAYSELLRRVTGLWGHGAGAAFIGHA